MTSIRPPEFVLAEDNPFKHDLLERHQRVEALCDLIQQLDQPAILAVNGPFGSGKSVFLRMCAAYLRSNEIAVAEFNAWQQSHMQLALVDLVAALTDGPLPSSGASQSMRDIAGELGWRAASAVTRGVVAREAFQQPAEAAKFDVWKAVEEARVKFREALCAVVVENGKLVVIIDELDRCLPARALEILDIARHLFDVPEVVVVLGINEQELHHRVTTLYGQDCNGKGYLRRFIDLTIDLPRPGDRLADFMNREFASVGLAGRLKAGPSDQYSGKMMELLAERSGMSLRDIKQFIQRIARVLALIPDPGYDDRTLFALQHLTLALCCLQWCDPMAYLQLTANEIDTVEAGSRLLRALGLEDELARGDAQAAMMLAVMLALEASGPGLVDTEWLTKRVQETGIGSSDVVEHIRSFFRGQEFGDLFVRQTLGRERVFGLVELARLSL